tara:strand:+ start:6292 stop:7527 length:1236 start_codon:yes stop_codon:yes gene_type:complete
MMTENKPENKTDNKFSHYAISEWDDPKLNLDTKLLRGIYAFGFEKPSAIQKKGLYPMTWRDNKGHGKDIIAQAQSGTGKTGCFVTGALQIIDTEYKNKDGKANTQILILAPTHELANQIISVANAMGKYLGTVTKLLVGGTSVDKDRESLDKNPPHIVVGTPGRVHDMIRRKYLRTDTIQAIILDEADEMLSSGFKEQVYKIFQYMPNEIQICLFSATIPLELDELTRKFMRNPTKILVKNEELTLQGIAQYFIRLDGDEQKYLTIKDLFASLSISQAIIYCNATRRVDDLHEAMLQDEYPVTKIHGKMEETERKTSYTAFKEGSCRVLITSDLFARGIDVQQVSIVINFDVPKSEHTYLHRIGRSGRWGRKGIAINFVSKHDAPRLKHFQEHYNTVIEEMPSDFTNHLNF